jgi:hypothetical protein
MKNLNILLLLLIFLFPGCQSDSFVNPEFGLQSEKNIKNWLQFEETGAFRLDKEVLVINEVNGKNGRTVEYDLNVANLSVNGTLTIPKNSFDGIMDISASFSNQSTTQTFGPSPFTFRKTLLLTLEYRGVNLRNINPSEIDFYYIDNSGQFHRAEYASLEINPEEGLLKVVDARINHFSRWGWAK